MVTTRIIQRFKGFIGLVRPFTLLAPLIVSVCIIISSFFYNSRTEDIFSIWLQIIIPASLTLAILNGASNALNQATDVKADKISKPYRPIPKGIVTINEAKTISFILYTIAFSLSLYVNLIFSVFICLIIIFTVTYSITPRMKDKLFFNQLWVAIPRGLLGIMASWSVFGNPIHPVPLSIGSIVMLFLIGGSITKDITDVEADKKTGTKTIINTYGVKKSAFISLPFLFFPFVIIPLLIEAGILESYLWLLTFLAIPSYLIFYLMIRDKKGCKILENTSAWAMMYFTYFMFAFGFSILTIIGSITA